MCLKSSISALLFVSSVSASPISSPLDLDYLQTRATFNCTDAAAIPASRCWIDLKVGYYLTNWYRSTPDCADNKGDGSDCCRYSSSPPETWSACFLRLATDSTGYNCDTTSVATCNFLPVELNDNLNPAARAPAMYAITAIREVHNMFASYDEGMSLPSLLFFPNTHYKPRIGQTDNRTQQQNQTGVPSHSSSKASKPTPRSMKH